MRSARRIPYRRVRADKDFEYAMENIELDRNGLLEALLSRSSFPACRMALQADRATVLPETPKRLADGWLTRNSQIDNWLTM